MFLGNFLFVADVLCISRPCKLIVLCLIVNKSSYYGGLLIIEG